MPVDSTTHGRQITLLQYEIIRAGLDGGAQHQEQTSCSWSPENRLYKFQLSSRDGRNSWRLFRSRIRAAPLASNQS